MEITNIKIRKLFEDKGNLKAILSITIDDCLAIHDIKVVQGESRLFVAMPSRKDEMGNFRDVVHPIYSETRRAIEEQILKAYEEYLAAAETEEGIE